MSKLPPPYYSSIIKLMYSVRVHSRRKRQRVSNQPILESSNKVCLPSKALNLPASKDERCYRYGGEDCETEGSMAAIGADEFGRVVEDGLETGRVGRVGGLEPSLLAEDDGGFRLSGGVEALCADVAGPR